MKRLLQSFLIDHPMVEDARLFEFKQPWLQKIYPLWPILVVVVAMFVGTFLLLAPLSFPINWLINTDSVLVWRTQNLLWDNYMLFAVTLTLGFGGVYLFIALFTRFVEKRSLLSLGFRTTHKGRKFLIGFVLGVVANLVIFLFVLFFTPSTLTTEGALITGVAAIPWVLLFLIPWAVQASAEEVIFTGWAFPHFAKKYGFRTAVIVVPLLFMAVHLLNPDMNIIKIVNLTLYGTFAVFYVLYQKSIIGIAAYHIGWNWSFGQLFGATRFADDQIAMTLLRLDRQGHALLTGGEFGSGGTLWETGILLISIVVILYLQSRRLKQT